MNGAFAAISISFMLFCTKSCQFHFNIDSVDHAFLGRTPTISA
jgi:hypothetical protein